MDFLNKLENQILSVLQTLYDAWGWFGVSGLLIFENATGITPSEIILGLAGWMLISEHQLPISMVFVGGFYTAIGSTLGASIPYWVARFGGRPLVDKLAHWVRISPTHITHAEQQFHRWGTGLVLVGRLIPGIRTLVSIPAGLARMKFLKFLAATFLGAYIWCALLIGAGTLLGHEWSMISNYVKQGFPFLVATGMLAMAIYLLLTHRAQLLAWAKTRNTD
jgi:membrane protein DedA with SNARE-associated domain